MADSSRAGNGNASTRNLQRVNSGKEASRKEASPSDSKPSRTPPQSLQASVNAIKTCRYLKGTSIKKPPNPDAEGLKAILLHPMNILLVFLPLGISAHFLDWGDLPTFWLNFLALVPLAKILGDATEELAASLKNDMVAGLLNATFGNAVELVITVNSLRAGLVRIVKTSLLGSVLSNTLLVLGMSFFFGGIFTIKNNLAEGEEAEYTSVHPEDLSRSSTGGSALHQESSMHDSGTKMNPESEKIQSFSLLGALVNTSMLLVSCLAFSLVTVFRCVLVEEGDDVQNILLPVSRVSSIIAMLAYIAYIFFQLVTHREAMSDESGEEEEEEDHIVLSVLASTALLCITTAIIAYVSDLMVDTISGLTEHAHISEHFIGIILLPIVGNACEHAAAVRFAVQDKLGLSVSIAVGSSTQIALFVVPLSVIAGWVMGQPMDLNFGILNSALITLSVIVVLSMVVDGQSNWLQGYLLCSVYCIISVMYWNLPNDVNDGMD